MKYHYQQLIGHAVRSFEQASRPCPALILSCLDYQKQIREIRGGFCVGPKRQILPCNLPRRCRYFAVAKGILTAWQAAYEYMFSQSKHTNNQSKNSNGI